MLDVNCRLVVVATKLLLYSSSKEVKQTERVRFFSVLFA
jgi:hypothetical protein